MAAHQAKSASLNHNEASPAHGLQYERSVLHVNVMDHNFDVNQLTVPMTFHSAIEPPENQQIITNAETRDHNMTEFRISDFLAQDVTLFHEMSIDSTAFSDNHILNRVWLDFYNSLYLNTMNQTCAAMDASYQENINSDSLLLDSLNGTLFRDHQTVTHLCSPTPSLGVGLHEWAPMTAASPHEMLDTNPSADTDLSPVQANDNVCVNKLNDYLDMKNVLVCNDTHSQVLDETSTTEMLNPGQHRDNPTWWGCLGADQSSSTAVINEDVINQKLEYWLHDFDDEHCFSYLFERKTPMSIQYGNKKADIELAEFLYMHNRNYSNNDTSDGTSESMTDCASMHMNDNTAHNIEGITAVC